MLVSIFFLWYIFSANQFHLLVAQSHPAILIVSRATQTMQLPVPQAWAMRISFWLPFSVVVNLPQTCITCWHCCIGWSSALWHQDCSWSLAVQAWPSLYPGILDQVSDRLCRLLFQLAKGPSAGVDDWPWRIPWVGVSCGCELNYRLLSRPWSLAKVYSAGH